MKTFTASLKILFVSAFLLFSKLNQAQCAASFIDSVHANGNVTFTSTSILTNSINTVYYWTFGNGIPTFTATGSAGMFPSYTYTANGTYTVTLFILSTAPSCSNATSAVITVTTVGGCALNSNFTISQGSNGLVNFGNTSSGTSSTTTYAWNFGNGQTSTLTSPATTYTANGTYIVTLFATNNSTPACTSTKTLAVNVTNICNVTASFGVFVNNSGIANFINNSGGTSTITSYYWNFGHSSAGNSGTSTATNPTHYYPNGTYTVSLSAFSTSLCVNTMTYVLTVNVCGLSGSFTHTVGTSGLVNFTSAYTGTLVSPSYNWNFGDGSTSNSANPSHTYLNGGTHYVNLVISDTVNSSCSDSITQAINITGIPCTANANFSLTPTSTPQYWNVVPAYPYNVTAAQWSWGDGGTSNSMYTAHQYSVAGNYTICLTVTVSCGSTASTCSTYYVYRSSDQSANPGIIYVNVVKPAAHQEVTGLTELKDTGLSVNIYPNPNAGNFQISVNGTVSQDSELQIYNLLGEMIYHEKFTSLKDESKEISLLNAEAGIYFVTLKTLNKTSTQKVIISK